MIKYLMILVFMGIILTGCKEHKNPSWPFPDAGSDCGISKQLTCNQRK